MPLVPTGSYRLAEQIGGWAVFAEITLSAVARADGQSLVTLDGDLQVDQHGRDIASIGFGAAYALGNIAQSECVGIIVHELYTNPVDTTPMALAYATCHAVLACFNESPTVLPYFDRNSRSFVFPARGPKD
jgi:hypothetical protein